MQSMSYKKFKRGSSWFMPRKIRRKKNFSEGTAFVLVWKMIRFQNVDIEKMWKWILANQTKVQNKGANINGSTLAKVKVHSGKLGRRGQSMGRIHIWWWWQRTGWTHTGAVALGKVNVHTISKPVYYQGWLKGRINDYGFM